MVANVKKTPRMTNLMHKNMWECVRKIPTRYKAPSYKKIRFLPIELWGTAMYDFSNQIKFLNIRGVDFR